MRELPRDDSSDLDFLLFRQHDVLSRAQALAHYTDAAIRHRVAVGRWQRPRRGVYVLQPAPRDDDQRRWIAVLAGPPGTVTAGRTALTQLGLRGFAVTAIHLLMPATVRDRDTPHDVIVHRARLLDPVADVHDLGSPPCTMPARSVVDAAQWARSDDEARAIVAATLQQRLVGPPEVRAVLARMSGVRRRPVITQAVNDAAGGAGSLPEAQFLALCRRGGLPRPKLQVSRRDTDGRQRYLDALFDQYGVHAEIDGAQHLDVRAYWADMRRQNALWVRGERVLRFPAWAVRNQPDEVLESVRAALRAAGWPG
ncbi:type IV toxin-antitoxin system AbiEi family antitoxin domain-containing protein [Catellatospora sichuanensis]|uniref:type IV toxin-antitoxin system AbiEi family antitoxin domain-containing protein n=1 Tax=Catellatospora sichuanensis TaxID=1969805 RepID=UPI001FEB81FE|nr:type IV toxin-antitoxin system AbiEi family antitoxin domain-containing protein [Catellatospora sichuanensis]